MESVEAVPFLTVRILVQPDGIVGSVDAPAEATIVIRRSPVAVPVGSPGVADVVLAALPPTARITGADI